MKILNSFIYNDYDIVTFFDDGQVTKYNFKEFMKNAPFDNLKNYKYFKNNFKFNWYKVYWDDETDCPADVLYNNGKPLKKLKITKYENKLPKIINCFIIPETYILCVFFDSNEIKLFDAEQYISKIDALKNLLDINYFNTMKVEQPRVYWSDMEDISAEKLYYSGKDYVDVVKK